MSVLVFISRQTAEGTVYKDVKEELVIKHFWQFLESQRDCFKNHHITVKAHSRSHKLQGFSLRRVGSISYTFTGFVVDVRNEEMLEHTS